MIINYNQSSTVSSTAISHWQALDDLPVRYHWQEIYALVATFIQSNLVQPLVWAVVSLYNIIANADYQYLMALINQFLSTITDPQFYNGLFNALKAYIEAHPWQTAALTALFVIGVILLCNPLAMIGFGALGPTAGTLATAWHSSIGAVASGSTYAILQSWGMMYTIWIPVVGIIIIGFIAGLIIAATAGEQIKS